MGIMPSTSHNPRSQPGFPSTCWSRIIGPAQGPEAPDLDALARAYWRPVHGFIRSFWARPDEDPRDCAQEFFVWMIESGFVAKADPRRGRFRAFLTTSLRNFLRTRERQRQAKKRGGDRVHVPLPDSENLPETALATPEAVLDELWRVELVAQATTALEDELRGERKQVYFDVFRDYYLSEQDLDYREVAARYGITVSSVSNYLTHAKRRYRSLLRSLVTETVASTEELEQELAWLFGAGAR